MQHGFTAAASLASYAKAAKAWQCKHDSSYSPDLGLEASPSAFDIMEDGTRGGQACTEGMAACPAGSSLPSSHIVQDIKGREA